MRRTTGTLFVAETLWRNYKLKTGVETTDFSFLNLSDFLLKTSVDERRVPVKISQRNAI